jgi:predicted RNA-binding protein YlqC (UPF0109 family)
MEKLITSIVKPLVDHPEEITIRIEEFDSKILYTLSVHEDDMGKVIGKQGRIAKAIRTVVYAASAHSEKRVILEIQ